MKFHFNKDEYTNFTSFIHICLNLHSECLCGNSGSGKTNPLYHILMKPLVCYDHIHLYAKNMTHDKRIE